MADLEVRMDNLEKRVDDLESNIKKSLEDIKCDVVEIKTSIKGDSKTNDYKNQLIEKDVKSNTERIDKLENNQSKLVWTIIAEVIGIVGAAVIAYLKIS